MKNVNEKDQHARERGAVTVELVAMCVLIAAACLIGIAVLGRALFRDTDVMNKGVSGQGSRAGTAMQCPNDGYRKQVEDDVKEAVKYNQEFSTVE